MIPLDFPNDKHADYSFSSLKNMADVYVEEVSYLTKKKIFDSNQVGSNLKPDH